MAFTFNGVSSDVHNISVSKVERSILPIKEAQMIALPRYPGAHYFHSEKGVRVFTVHCDVIGEESLEAFESRIRDIAEWLDTDGPAPLIFDYEPEMTYHAVVEGETGLERLGTFGQFAIHFICPDPYAEGETKTQRIENAHVTFHREGIRYRADGSEVTENYPVYRDGKFGKAILIEEGTTNLLSTASEPQVEDVSVSIGSNYTLSNVGGSVSIEHKKTENLPITELSKTGQDVVASHRAADFQEFTHNNTQIDDGSITLERGAEISDVVDSDAKWDGQGTHNGTIVDGGYLTLHNRSWDYSMPCDSIAPEGWVEFGTGSGQFVSAEGGKITIECTSPALSGGTGVRYAHGVSNMPQTFAARYYHESSSGGGRLWFNNGDGAVRVALPVTDGEGFQWVMVRRTSGDQSGNVELYIDGELIESQPFGTDGTYLSFVTDNTGKNFQLYISTGETGKCIFDHVYFSNELIEAPPANGVYDGEWTSNTISLDQLITVLGAETTLSSEKTGAAPEEDQAIAAEFQKNDEAWQEISEANIAAAFPKGLDAGGQTVKYRIKLTSRDPGAVPVVSSLMYVFSPGYAKSGEFWAYVDEGATYAGGMTDLQPANFPASSTYTESATRPPNTSLRVFGKVSDTAEKTAVDAIAWAELLDRQQLPFVDQNENLGNKLLWVKIALSTEDVAVSPSFDQLEISVISGYELSASATLPATELTGIGYAVSSFVTWDETNTANTSTLFEYSMDGSTWEQLQKDGAFISEIDTDGKTLSIRYSLSTTDRNETPSVGSTLSWRIAQQDPARIKPVTDTIVLTPSNVDRWQLENKPYPTGWHAYGAPRNPESIYIWTDGVLEDVGTIELWVYESGIDTDRHLFATDGSSGFDLLHTQSGDYVVNVEGTPVITVSAPTVGWHALALRWDGSEIAVFIDGSPVGTASSSVSFADTSKLYLGCDPAGARQWNGLLDELRISDIARTDAEIADGFASNAPLPVDDSTTFKATFDGTLAPTTGDKMVVEGTAPTQPVFTATIIVPTTYIKISDGVKFVHITPDTGERFEVGDEIVIDNEKAKVTVNGWLNMPEIDSDFFSVEKGEYEFSVEPAGVARVEASFTERWK